MNIMTGRNGIKVSKEERRKLWKEAIALNQIDCEWIPSKEYMDLVEKEINGEITIEEMKDILIKKHTRGE